MKVKRKKSKIINIFLLLIWILWLICFFAYEPWHYRYVGTEAAEAIFNNGVCLEEYLTQGR